MKLAEKLINIHEGKFPDSITGRDLLDKKYWEWSEKMAGGEFAVVDRGDTGKQQDQFRMIFVKGGKVAKDWGTHPSAKGSRGFFNNRVKGGDGIKITKEFGT